MHFAIKTKFFIAFSYSQQSRTCFSRIFLASFYSVQTSHKIAYAISSDLGAHSLTARHVRHEQVHSHDRQRIYENYYDEVLLFNMKKPGLCHWTHTNMTSALSNQYSWAKPSALHLGIHFFTVSHCGRHFLLEMNHVMLQKLVGYMKWYILRSWDWNQCRLLDKVLVRCNLQPISLNE